MDIKLPDIVLIPPILDLGYCLVGI